MHPQTNESSLCFVMLCHWSLLETLGVAYTNSTRYGHKYLKVRGLSIDTDIVVS